MSGCECRYAMREALAISSEEGLKELWQRHENMHHMLWDGLKSMGLKSFVENDSERLITVNTVTVLSSTCQLVQKLPTRPPTHLLQCCLHWDKRQQVCTRSTRIGLKA